MTDVARTSNDVVERALAGVASWRDRGLDKSTSHYLRWAIALADEVSRLRGTLENPAGELISGGRCWHCRNQIMIAPSMGCPTCGRDQDLNVLYFGMPEKYRSADETTAEVSK